MKNIYLLLSFAIISCNSTSQDLKEVGDLDLKEASGIEYITGNDLLWTIEDQGNDNILYGLDTTGKTSAAITITNVKNNDWEDITSDKEGNIYIGDFGNNKNDRQDLAIYKIDKADLSGKTAQASAIINFSYPEQTEFPPKKSQRVFDVEAFFEKEGNFYLFTKNRSSKFNGSLSIYKVPNQRGSHKAKLIGHLTTCNLYKKCAVTAADISPDGKTVVLLSADKVYTITGFTGDDYAGGTMTTHNLGHFSQKEGLCFKDDNTIIIADEKDKKTGGKLYEIKLSDLKAKP